LKKGATIAFRNLRSDVFEERHRLGLDRWGKLSNEVKILKFI